MMIALVLLLVALIAATSLAWQALAERDWRREQPLGFEPVATARTLIAHASGGHVQGNYANAMECLDEWHGHGVRYFEFDLQWTRDGQLIGLHDWGPTLRRWFHLRRLPLAWRLIGPLMVWSGLPSRPWQALPMRAGLTPITPERLAVWLAAHPDAWLVTDIKRDNARALNRLAEVLGDLKARVLAQTFSLEEVRLARALGYGEVAWANYVPDLPLARLPAHLQGAAIDRVVLDAAKLNQADSASALAALKARGLSLWVFTINTTEQLNALPEAIDGVITDRLLPAPRTASPAGPPADRPSRGARAAPD